MDLIELDRRIAEQQARLAGRKDERPVCVHEWGTAYKSSSGRKVCTKCGLVTDKPFETLGVAERGTSTRRDVFTAEFGINHESLDR